MMRVINVPIRIVAGLPFATRPSGRLMPIPLTGRTTGKSCRQPVSYARHGTTLSAPGRDQRKLNLQESRPQCIQLRGHLPRPGRGQEGTGADPLTRSPVGRSGI